MSKPQVVDLFSGCGGLSLGFAKAGFEIATGIELVPEACHTLNANIHWRYGKSNNHICGDITRTESAIFKEKIGNNECIVVGGPPCQAYSLAGRAKLRSLGVNRVNTNDARGYLYQDFLRIALDLDAKVIVMENVPESTNYGGKNIPELVCETLEHNDYNAYWTILNAADFGVPQIRERVFMLAVKKELGDVYINLPQPTHYNPIGELSPHQKRLSTYEKYQHFRKPILPKATLTPWVTVKQAFSDLPSLKISESTPFRKYELNIELPYYSAPQNVYQSLMRTWWNENFSGVSGNAYRNNNRDFPIFERMKQGDTYVEAVEIATNLLNEKAIIMGYMQGTDDYERLRSKVVPKYSTEKFLNKWQRLDETKPSHTVVAHLCTDTYSHIHPWEGRGITVREAARLQSFPDDFRFSCSMGDAFKQIGNAVPPLLSYAIAKSILKLFS